MSMNNHIHAEVSGEHLSTGQTYGSDICWEGEVNPSNAKEWHEWRNFLHDNLDEFLDNFTMTLNNENGGQYFYVGYPPKD